MKYHVFFFGGRSEARAASGTIRLEKAILLSPEFCHHLQTVPFVIIITICHHYQCHHHHHFYYYHCHHQGYGNHHHNWNFVSPFTFSSSLFARMLPVAKCHICLIQTLIPPMYNPQTFNTLIFFLL